MLKFQANQGKIKGVMTSQVGVPPLTGLFHFFLSTQRVKYFAYQLMWGGDDDEFRFNDASTHEGHLRQNGELTWFCSETIIMISHKCIKCKTRMNLKIKAVILC